MRLTGAVGGAAQGLGGVGLAGEPTTVVVPQALAGATRGARAGRTLGEGAGSAAAIVCVGALAGAIGHAAVVRTLVRGAHESAPIVVTDALIRAVGDAGAIIGPEVERAHAATTVVVADAVACAVEGAVGRGRAEAAAAVHGAESSAAVGVSVELVDAVSMTGGVVPTSSSAGARRGER